MNFEDYPDFDKRQAYKSRKKQTVVLTNCNSQGWNNPEGDVFFQKQRQRADECDDAGALRFFRIMKNVGEELHQSTNAFAIRPEHGDKTRILDMCMAPGGFLWAAMAHNPGCRAVAFSLPKSAGGHKVLLPHNSNVDKRFLDVTMLTEDMGVDHIPHDHLDMGLFLPRQLNTYQLFDLVLCDGQVLRTHIRSTYREKREATRFKTSQLALGLEHLRPGGSMIVLLHKVENWDTAKLLYQFQEFSSIKLLKPKTSHKIRSSFYMIATDVQSQHPSAAMAIRGWKATWKVATFGSEDDYSQFSRKSDTSVDEMLDKFGLQLLDWGRDVWRIQADALAKSTFVRNTDKKLVEA